MHQVIGLNFKVSGKLPGSNLENKSAVYGRNISPFFLLWFHVNFTTAYLVAKPEAVKSWQWLSSQPTVSRQPSLAAGWVSATTVLRKVELHYSLVTCRQWAFWALGSYPSFLCSTQSSTVPDKSVGDQYVFEWLSNWMNMAWHNMTWM